MLRKSFILSAALAVAVSAFGQQQFIADKVVAVVGGSPILYSDVVSQAEVITEQYRSQNYTSPRDPMSEALELLLEQKLLYQRAQIDSIGLERLAGNIAGAVEENPGLNGIPNRALKHLPMRAVQTPVHHKGGHEEGVGRVLRCTGDAQLGHLCRAGKDHSGRSRPVLPQDRPRLAAHHPRTVRLRPDNASAGLRRGG